MARTAAAQAIEKVAGWWQARAEAQIRDRYEVRAFRRQGEPERHAVWDKRAKGDVYEPQWVADPPKAVARLLGPEIAEKNRVARAEWDAAQAAAVAYAKEQARAEAQRAKERAEAKAIRDEIRALAPQAERIMEDQKGRLVPVWSTDLDPAERERRDNLFAKAPKTASEALAPVLKSLDPAGYKAWDRSQDRGYSR